MTKTWLSLAATLTIGLAGCGWVAEDPPPSASTSAGSPSAGSSSAPATSTSSPEPPTPPQLPSGYAWQTVDDAGLTFAAPETWTAINPKKLLEAGDLSALDEMAERMGMTSSQMRVSVGNVAVLLAAPPKNGYADNITGIVVPLAGLPTESQIKAQLESVLETPVVVTESESPAGPMVAAEYVLKVGSADVNGRTLFFNGPDGVLNLSVSATDAKSADTIAELLRSTIHAS